MNSNEKELLKLKLAASKGAVLQKVVAEGAKQSRMHSLLEAMKKHKKIIAGGAAGVGTAALLAKIIKSRSAAKGLLSQSKLTAVLKKHKKPLMVGGGVAAGAAGLGALLSNK